MAKKILLLSGVLLLCSSIFSQSLSQLGFIIKKAIPYVENIAVICYGKSFVKNKIEREARPATLITKKKYSIFPVESKSEIAQMILKIEKLDNAVVVVIADNKILTPETVQFIAQKTLDSQIPVISNRPKDTLQGAVLSIYIENEKIQKHINKIIVAALNLNIAEPFLTECIVDAE